MTNVLNQVVKKIIEEQALIIGPLAWDEAKKVRGLQVDRASNTIQITSSPSVVIDNLVKQYERLFGRA